MTHHDDYANMTPAEVASMLTGEIEGIQSWGSALNDILEDGTLDSAEVFELVSAIESAYHTARRLQGMLALQERQAEDETDDWES